MNPSSSLPLQKDLTSIGGRWYITENEASGSGCRARSGCFYLGDPGHVSPPSCLSFPIWKIGPLVLVPTSIVFGGFSESVPRIFKLEASLRLQSTLPCHTCVPERGRQILLGGS